METTRLSGKGQVFCQTHPFGAPMGAGSRVLGGRHSRGVLLRPLKPFKPTRLEAVVGCAGYVGPRKTLEDMEAAIAVGIRAHDDRG